MNYNEVYGHANGHASLVAGTTAGLNVPTKQRRRLVYTSWYTDLPPAPM